MYHWDPSFRRLEKGQGGLTLSSWEVQADARQAKEEIVPCRLDHYQTPMQVHVSAFAKG